MWFKSKSDQGEHESLTVRNKTFLIFIRTEVLQDSTSVIEPTNWYPYKHIIFEDNSNNKSVYQARDSLCGKYYVINLYNVDSRLDWCFSNLCILADFIIEKDDDKPYWKIIKNRFFRDGMIFSSLRDLQTYLKINDITLKFI